MEARRSSRFKLKLTAGSGPKAENADADLDDDDDGNDVDAESDTEFRPPPRKHRRTTTSSVGNNDDATQKIRGRRGKLRQLPEMPLDILFDVRLDRRHLAKKKKTDNHWIGNPGFRAPQSR
jgi:hypothetical protein